MLKRFQEERKRSFRSSNAQYNLGSDHEDNDDFELMLTHKGERVTDESLKASHKDNDDNDQYEGQLNRDIVSQLHFSQSRDHHNLNPSENPMKKKKSHLEIMKEVMAKSKFYKAQRQQAQVEDEEAMDALDVEFDAVSNLLQFRDKNEEKHQDRQAPEDVYDRLTRQLRFESKAKASDRTLSVEEQAQKDKDRLDRLERERLARMEATVDSGSEEHSEEEEELSEEEEELSQEHSQEEELSQERSQEHSEEEEEQSQKALTRAFNAQPKAEKIQLRERDTKRGKVIDSISIFIYSYSFTLSSVTNLSI